MANRISRLSSRVSLPFLMLSVLLAILWLAGGSARADVLGQVLVRASAWTAIIGFVLSGRPLALGNARPVAWLIGLAVLLPLLQLLPLPPAVWRGLPGRDIVARAASVSGQDQAWQPLSIVPGATLNALSSLVVPVAIFLLAIAVDSRERRRLPGLLLLLVIASALVALGQISGNYPSNIFINDEVGQVSGMFANRNHLALLLALGCVLAPSWAFLRPEQARWRAPLMVGMLLLFVLIIMASGSRVGLVLGVVGTTLGLISVRLHLIRLMARVPKRLLISSLVGFILAVAALVFATFAFDRASSFQRMLTSDVGRDMRTLSLPTLWSMIREYFPLGYGLGGFDPLFRMHEPFALLKLTYFNHAHNDFIEIALDSGVLGMLVTAAAIGWGIWRGWRVWSRGTGHDQIIPRLGTAMLLLIVAASLFDYPARTPFMMAVVTLAGLWSVRSARDGDGSALPDIGGKL